MRIVHGGLPYLPIPHSRGGANEKIIYELARAQAKDHEVHIISVGPQPNEVRTDEVQIHYIPYDRGPGAEYGFYVRMAQMTRQLAADILHLHASSLAGLILKSLPGHRIPVVVSLNYPFIRPDAGLGRWGSPVDMAVGRLSLAKVDLFAFISEYSHGMFRGRYRKVRGRKVVIPVGVDTERYGPDESLRAHTRACHHWDACKVVLFVGRICEQKGVHVLVEAMAQLVRDDPSYRLVLVGPAASTFHDSADAPFAEAIIQRTRALGGVYLGVLNEDELIAILNGADVLVLPTLKWEMFGMVLIEAMACGRTVVASDHGGIPEVIDGCPAGRLFPPGDSQALASVLCQIFAAGLSDASVARARAQVFSWDKIAAMYENEYMWLKRVVSAEANQE